MTRFRALPEEARARFFSWRPMTFALLASLALATAVSCLYWYATALQGLLMPYWKLLDVVPSLFARLLPAGARSGFHWYFTDGTYCFPGSPAWESMRYLRTAIPAYALLFFAMILGARLMKKRARRYD